MASKGIAICGGPDAGIEARAKQAGLGVMAAGAGDDALVPFDKTLFVEAGTAVPWDMISAAWHFLARWDAAVPLWRYGVTAADVGTPAERKRTAAVVRDLRVLLHSVELLFVRDNADGRALMAALAEERADGGEKRLAFLRAMYRVKPRVCVLPLSWMAAVQARATQDAKSVRLRKRSGPMVRVEVAPGRWVQCHAGDEAAVLAQFANQGRRRGRG